MNYLKERVAYLKGLAEGMQISDATNEGKLMKAIINVLEDMAIAVDDVEEVQEKLSEQVDEIDENLSEIERLVFDGEDDDGCECECGEEDECECDDEDEDAETEIDCPHCGKSIILGSDEITKDTVVCPYCNKEIELEWISNCEDCDDESDR